MMAAKRAGGAKAPALNSKVLTDKGKKVPPALEGTDAKKPVKKGKK